MGADNNNNEVKAPTFTFTALTAALVALVSVMALTVRQTPPPTVAEFAPQAREQIKDAPDEQSSKFGSDPGTGGGGVISPTPTETETEEIDIPRVKNCVGKPPRQTEDPQSPRCVNYWEGDNGGPTSVGVTANEIRIAFPKLAFENDAAIRALAAHFNHRYTFYDRKIVLQTYSPKGGLISHPDPAKEKSDADFVASQLKSFASLSTGIRWGSGHHYYNRLQHHKVISVAVTGGALATTAEFEARKPYRWSVMPPIDTILRSLGEFVCNQLNENPPRFASGDAGAEPTRKFGLLYQRATDNVAPDLTPLQSTLESCGAEPIVTVEDRPSSDPARNGENAMIQFRTAGVTSIICLCQCDDARGVLMPAATSQAYQPEWILSSYINHDVDNCHRQAPPEQVNGIMGLAFRNKWLPRAEMPWYWALTEQGTNNPSEGDYYHLLSRYSQMLLIASGIQLAGPNLTPETFAKGLHQATAFPNDRPGQAPYFQAKVGFPGGRYTMMDDAMIFWYDTSQRGAAEASLLGSVCYVDLGKRQRIGSWSKAEPNLKQGPCF